MSGLKLSLNLSLQPTTIACHILSSVLSYPLASSLLLSLLGLSSLSVGFPAPAWNKLLGNLVLRN